MTPSPFLSGWKSSNGLRFLRSPVCNFARERTVATVRFAPKTVIRDQTLRALIERPKEHKYRSPYLDTNGCIKES